MGTLLYINKLNFKVQSTILLSRQNIRSIYLYGDYIYTAGQDKSLYLIDAKTQECIAKRRKVHNRMFDYVSVYKDSFITISYPSSEIAFWNKESLEHEKSINIPLKLSGRTVIEGDKLYVASRSIDGIVSVDLS